MVIRGQTLEVFQGQGRDGAQTRYQEISPEHFYWPDIDVDLDLGRIQHPDRVPLVAKTRG